MDDSWQSQVGLHDCSSFIDLPNMSSVLSESQEMSFYVIIDDDVTYDFYEKWAISVMWITAASEARNCSAAD